MLEENWNNHSCLSLYFTIIMRDCKKQDNHLLKSRVVLDPSLHQSEGTIKIEERRDYKYYIS